MNIFISGPYTRGCMDENLKQAIDAASELADNGIFSYIPHLNILWNIVHPRPYEFWMSLCLSMLPKFDAVLRLPVESPGADREVRLAEILGIPVFYTPEELIAWAEGK